MSRQLITAYYSKVEKLIQFGGSKKETSVRNEFYNLLNSYAEKKSLVLVAELPVRGTKGRDVTPDGTLKNVLRLDYGYWESKDEALELDEEIDKKIRKGYPLTNILFEDSNIAALYQNGAEIMRIDMHEADELDRILSAFVAFEKPEVLKFVKALEHFQQDVPTILETLRTKIEEARKKNKAFIAVSNTFLELCRAEINPDVTPDDVREMMIQHILTCDIFNIIFDDADFIKHNNIAGELEKLIGTLFTYAERKNLLAAIEHYYDAINATAASIADHHEKQKFLKALYENFYKAYNPKAADRLGVVYTPNEIVDFMIDGANCLLERHFERVLWDKNVEILDPASGTGTYICSMIDKCPKRNLPHKFKNELHANEVAILPYYIANLNIEYTFKQKMQYYEEFPSMCFVDTLDNIDGLTVRLTTGQGLQKNLFQFTAENSKRIHRQNAKKISVIIGNPPYNANQKNENENNKNREYTAIDKRIKDTFIKYSTAQKTKAYDMYARFYRWAMDRIDTNGVIAFITNRSFLDSRTFDGFRKCIEDGFLHCYIVDTKSDVRANPQIAGTTHNVFGIQTGVAVMFLVRSGGKPASCSIDYFCMSDDWRKEEKLTWFASNSIGDVPFERIRPDKNHNWLNQTTNDWDALLPLISKETKSDDEEGAIFRMFASSIKTNRDEWVYDWSDKGLVDKVAYLINGYEKTRLAETRKDVDLDYSIKWSSGLKAHLRANRPIEFSAAKVRQSLWRPFVKQYFYSDKLLSDRLTALHYKLWGKNLDKKNRIINLSGLSAMKPFQALASDSLSDYEFVEKNQCIPLYLYNIDGKRSENVTAWGVKQFRTFYKDKKISAEDIFHYVYAVLYNPAYRSKYERNLKRELPRIPLYKQFWQWAKWGKRLMDLHIDFEKALPFDLAIKTNRSTNEQVPQHEIFPSVAEPEAMYARKPRVRARLRADKEAGTIELDDNTTLTGVPSEAWDFRLGNRSALEWILDQFKEKKPSDPTIHAKFNSYNFADHKEAAIGLIKRICTVSLETSKIVNHMNKK